MAVTKNSYTGNGSTVLYSFTFPYLETSDIKVSVNGVDTNAFTLANATTVQLNSAPAAGTEILIYRRTDTDTPKATFYPGSSIRSQDLNNNTTQSLYSVQEWQDQTAPLFNAVFPDDVSLGGNQINNLAEPTAGTDAATKNYVDTTTWDNTTETLDSTEAWASNNTRIATTGAIDGRITSRIASALTSDVEGADGVVVNDNTPSSGKITIGLNPNSVDLDRIKDEDLITTTEQNAGTPVWTNEDSKVPTAGALARRHDMLIQPNLPSGSNWQPGKLWYQNDNSKTLNYWTGSQWSGIVSGLPFVEQPSVIYVDSINGDDLNSGNRIVQPKKTIKAAVTAANAGDIIKVTPGVYQESLPIDITVANLSIVGDATRSVFVHPTPATETEIMFRCNSGTYIDGFTFCGLKASGARGDHPIDDDPTYGLPEFQGWVAGFYPGAIIRKSPWIQNSTNFADSGIDNSTFDPNNYSGTGGDTTSGPTGGGVIVDGSLPDVTSPLRSFVINEFTQVCLDGPGLLVCNNGYAQAVSYFGIFNHYQAKALSGGQINMEVGTTNFGRFGLIADGKSTAPIFTATANGAAAADDVTFAVNAPTADPSWFGDATRPAINMLVKIGSDIYPILTASPNGTGWNVTISRPDPTDRSINLGLINGHSDTDPVEFFLRSMVSTASHTFEYAGAGTNYSALPENGGVPVELNEAINVNDGRVWLTSTDQTGKFKVGDTFQVDQQTGYVTIDPSSISTNIVSDNSPQLGGDLDVLTRRITTSLGNTGVVIEGNGNGPVTLKSGAADRFVVSPTQLTAGFLGTAAAPAYSFIADPDTGLLSPGANELALSTGGTARLTIDASGNVAVPGGLSQGGNNVLTTAGGAVTGDVTLNAQSDLRFADADSSNWVAFQGPATVSSNVTWTLPAADGTSGQVLSTNGSGTLSWATGGGGGGGASVTTSDTAPSTPADGDLWYDSVGGRLYVYYEDPNTSQWVDAAPQGGGDAGFSKLEVGNTKAEVTDTGSNGTFTVTTEGTSRLTVGSTGNVSITNGNLVFSTAGTGIDFSATANSSGTMTSELLSDYEEGTWTPSSSFSGGIGTRTQTTAGSYTKIGDTVYAWFDVSITKGTAAGTLIITGLPFTSSGTQSKKAGVYFVYISGLATLTNALYAYIGNSSTAAVCYNGPNLSALEAPGLNASCQIIGTAIYKV